MEHFPPFYFPPATCTHDVCREGLLRAGPHAFDVCVLCPMHQPFMRRPDGRLCAFACALGFHTTTVPIFFSVLAGQQSQRLRKGAGMPLVRLLKRHDWNSPTMRPTAPPVCAVNEAKSPDTKFLMSRFVTAAHLSGPLAHNSTIITLYLFNDGLQDSVERCTVAQWHTKYHYPPSDLLAVQYAQGNCMCRMVLQLTIHFQGTGVSEYRSVRIGDSQVASLVSNPSSGVLPPLSATPQPVSITKKRVDTPRSGILASFSTSAVDTSGIQIGSPVPSQAFSSQATRRAAPADGAPLPPLKKSRRSRKDIDYSDYGDGGEDDEDDEDERARIQIAIAASLGRRSRGTPPVDPPNPKLSRPRSASASRVSSVPSSPPSAASSINTTTTTATITTTTPHHQAPSSIPAPHSAPPTVSTPPHFPSESAPSRITHMLSSIANIDAELCDTQLRLRNAESSLDTFLTKLERIRDKIWRKQGMRDLIVEEHLDAVPARS